jgi:hypothetical protein
MNRLKLTKDQIKKLALSSMGMVFLLYVYFTFFLGPLNRSRQSALVEIKDRQAKLGSSSEEISKAAKLEQKARNDAERFAMLKGFNPEGAPLAWFPPRMKTFFANHGIDKAVARLEGSSPFNDKELSGWAKYNWIIELAQADYGALGRAVAELENSEPLLTIRRINISATQDQPQFQKVNLAVTDIISDKR